MAVLNFLLLTTSRTHLDEETVFCIRISLHLLCKCNELRKDIIMLSVFDVLTTVLTSIKQEQE